MWQFVWLEWILFSPMWLVSCKPIWSFMFAWKKIQPHVLSILTNLVSKLPIYSLSLSILINWIENIWQNSNYVIYWIQRRNITYKSHFRIDCRKYLIPTEFKIFQLFSTWMNVSEISRLIEIEDQWG